MMIQAKHNYLIYNFFKFYIRIKIRFNFHKVIISGEYKEKNFPVLLISNHISWWDGFWAMYLNMKVFKRRFYFMMEENQLNKYWFFKFTGGFPVRKKSRNIIESLRYAGEILSDKGNLLLMFPEGRINSLYNRSFFFERGLERILKKTKGGIHLVFAANLIDYYSESRPTLFIYLREYTVNGFITEAIRNEYALFYEECVSENLKKAY